MAVMVFGSRYPSVTFEREMVQLPPVLGPVLDRGWVFTDAAGHEHSGRDLRATLTEITEERYDPDDDETWEAHVRWECSLCGEVIQPGTRTPDPGGETVPGALVATVVEVRGGLLWERWYRMPDGFGLPGHMDDVEDVVASVVSQGRQIADERCLGTP